MLSENIAILDWIADQAPKLRPEGAMGRTHLLEALAYISTEIHKSFKPFFAGGSDEEKQKAGEAITKRFQYLADGMTGDYLFGAQFSVADAYLFVMTMWANKMGVTVPDPLPAFAERVKKREGAAKALKMEGLG